MTKNEKAFTIWPSHLDASKPRSRGRKLPREKAVEAPTPEEIFEACKELSYPVRLEGEKRYPSSWWERPGRVSVDKKVGERKKDLLVKISAAIARKRTLKRRQ